MNLKLLANSKIFKPDVFQQLLFDYQNCRVNHPGINDNTKQNIFEKGLVANERRDKTIKRIFEERAILQEQLSNSKLWQRHPQLSPLRSVINPFSCYSWQAIQAAAFIYLPTIEDALHDTQGSYRYQSKKLTKSEQKAHKVYLKQSLKSIKQEKRELAQAYYHRMVVLAKTGHCDVLNFVASQFYNHGENQLKISSISMKKPKRGEFRSAVSFIYQYGSSKQIKHLTNLNWPTDKTHALIIRGDYILKIPKALCPLISRTPGYWWQKGTRLRYRMAKQLDELNHNIRATLCLITPLTDYSFNTALTRFKQLDNLQHQLASHINLFKHQQPKNLFTCWLQRETQQATEKAIDYLMDRQALLASRQLQILNKMVGNFQHTVNPYVKTHDMPINLKTAVARSPSPLPIGR